MLEDQKPKKEAIGKKKDEKEEIEIWVPANTQEVKIKELDIKEGKGAKLVKQVTGKTDTVNLGLKSREECMIDEEKQKILQMSEISLWLDTYDDIFSDFDPRPYEERALSEDFLNEAKRASKEKSSGGLELKFLIPSSMRSVEKEINIKKRLRDHFKKHYRLLHSEINRNREKGILLILIGAGVTLIATTIKTLNPTEMNFWTNFCIAVLEPAGWFMTWEGLFHISSSRKQKEVDIEFYDKMAKCVIKFLPY